jgi:hypothetical protein
MSHTFSRHELFDLVWSEPTRTIAKRLGISDVGLAKACRRADLLLPPRGYWAKLGAGKTVRKATTADAGAWHVGPDRVGSGPLELGTRAR